MTADALPEPLPPGVLGYVVARHTAKPVLTNSDLMDRATAEHEATQWRRGTASLGGRVVVCEVREVTG